MRKKVCFSTNYETKKLALFCPVKDFIPTHQKSNVVYCFACPGSNQKYIGKTDHDLVTCVNEQRSSNDQPMYHPINLCNF